MMMDPSHWDLEAVPLTGLDRHSAIPLGATVLVATSLAVFARIAVSVALVSDA